MKSMMIALIIMTFTCFAQLDSLDRIELKNSQTYTGKVIKVTSSTVQFRESITNLLHEYNKSEIKDLRLSNGTTITFNTTTEDKQNVTGTTRTEDVNTSKPPSTGQVTDTKQPNKETPPNNAAPAEKSSGMNTSLIIVLAAGGLVALILLGALIF
ncbi:MAG: hypothetical protein ACM3S2_03790 [Ignavibacteriales bacterium]